MIDEYTDDFGGKWLFDYEPFDNEVEITDVFLNGEQIPGEMIAEEWIKKQQKRIACVVFGSQAHS